MPSEGFLTDIRTVELFFRVCRRYKVTSLEARTALMREITKRGKAKYLRDVAAYTAGKRVVFIRPKRSQNEEHN